MKLATLMIALGILVLALPLCSAASSIGIRIGSGDIVTADFFFEFNSSEAFDAYSFLSAARPLSIAYDGEYSLRQENSSFIITFDKAIEPGMNNIAFTILYDDLVESSGKGKVFRSSFGAEEYYPLGIVLTLPESAILSGNPSVSPIPDAMTTDGRSITLDWVFENPEKAGIVVFYQPDSSPMGIILIAAIVVLVLVILAVIAAWRWNRMRVKKAVTEVLSNDEQKVVVELRKGSAKQSDIAKSLGFSKSKMSKVIRKLELKKLIEKEPWFKTNKLALKKIK